MKRLKLTEISFLLSVLLSLALSGASAFALPLIVKDCLGNVVYLKAFPQRIVSLAPSITETLFAIGAGKRIVGTTVFDDYPPQAKKTFKVGGFSNPNIEKILYVKPDLVLGISNIHSEIMKRLRSFNIQCFAFKLFDRLSRLYYEIEMLGKLTGCEKKARLLLKELKLKIENLRKEGKKLKSHPRVFMIIWDNPLVTIGRGSYIHELIEIAGGKSITSLLPAPFPLYSVESLIKASPDIIIVAGGKGGMSLTKERVLRSLEGKGIKAISRGNIFEIESNLIFRLSPRIVKGIENLYEIFRKWSEKDQSKEKKAS